MFNYMNHESRWDSDVVKKDITNVKYTQIQFVVEILCSVTSTYVSNLVEFGLKCAKTFYWEYVSTSE